MSPVLVDANVLIDVITDNPTWGAWSADKVQQLSDATVLAINPLIYAEVSAGLETVEDLEDALPRDLYERVELPYEAAFLAGKCFLRYRRRGGQRRSPLPDFYIGAHAAVAGYRLLTRDAKRYREYFPTLEMIAP